MTDSMDLTLKIMALVDEFPSEPLSFERKQIELKLETLVAKHTGQIDNERDAAYEMGQEDGFAEGYDQATDELEGHIQDLEDEISELKEDLEQKIDDAFTEGYESARIEYGLN